MHRRTKIEEVLIFCPPPADPLQELRSFGGEGSGQVGFELKLRRAEYPEAFGDLMAQELPRMGESLQGGFLLFHRALKGQMDMGVPVIRREIHVADGDAADTGVR